MTFPLLAKIQDDDERLIAVYRKYIRVTSCGIFFLMALLAALAKPLICLLLTDKWADAAIYCQLFCFDLMFDHLCQLNLNLLQVKGRSDLFLKLEVIKKAIAFVILCAAIPFGVTAICVSSIIYTQIAVFINTYYTGKLFGLGYLSQFKDYGKYLLAAVTVCAPAFCLSLIGLSDMLVLIFGVAIAALLYWFIMRNDDAFYDIIQSGLNIIKRRETR